MNANFTGSQRTGGRCAGSTLQPPASDRVPLRHLDASERGSETSADPREEEVRAGRGVSRVSDFSGGSQRSQQPQEPAESPSREPSDPGPTRPRPPPRPPAGMGSLVAFYTCYLLCLALGLACVAGTCAWSVRWRGGLAWDGSALQFNWHPVLMVAGLVATYGCAAVLYRVPLTWGQNKLPWKLLHAALMLLALVLSVVGLRAVFDFHNAKQIKNLYSLHSWVGISAAALFAAQWAMGAAAFLLPCSPAPLRKLLKPVHVWFGGGILSLSVVACVSGINEKLFFSLKGNANGTQPYAALPPEAVLGNSLGVLIVVFGAVVLGILSNPKWQRPDSPPGERAYAPLLQEDDP